MSSLTRSLCRVMSVLGVLGCGGGDATVDGGAPADAHTNTCPGAATVFTLASGSYVATRVSNIAETCGLGLTEADLMGARMVTVDDTGGVTLAAADGSSSFGSGAVRCNSGTLMLSANLQGGECQYASTRASTVTVTANNQLTVQYTEMRSAFMSVPGMTCRQTAPCSIQFTLNLQR